MNYYAIVAGEATPENKEELLRQLKKVLPNLKEEDVKFNTEYSYEKKHSYTLGIISS